MFAQKVAIVAMSALTVVSAAAGNSTFTIDPNSVTLATRASWCTAEQNACTQICGNAPDNDCDVNTLSYSCTCDDGTSPNMNEYANTLPFFICQQAFTNCNLANVGSATGQANCTTNIQDNCGTKNASSAATTTSSAASSTATSTGTATKSAASQTGSATSTSSSKAAAMPTGIQHLSNGAIAVAGLLAFAL